MAGQKSSCCMIGPSAPLYAHRILPFPLLVRRTSRHPHHRRRTLGVCDTLNSSSVAADDGSGSALRGCQTEPPQLLGSLTLPTREAKPVEKSPGIIAVPPRAKYIQTASLARPPAPCLAILRRELPCEAFSP